MNRVWWMFIILAVSIFGSGAISIVWLRMEISATAKIAENSKTREKWLPESCVNCGKEVQVS